MTEVVGDGRGHGWLGVVDRKADLNWKLKISNNGSVRLGLGAF